MRKTTLAIFIALLTACAVQVPDISTVDPNNLSEEQALLIFSTAADDTCVSFGSSVVLKPVSAASNLGESIGGRQLNNPFVDSHFEDDYVLVHTMVVSPGEYDFWLHSTNPNTYYEDEEQIVSKPFSIAPKEIRYIGEIRSTGCKEIRLTVSDRRKRDLEFVSSSSPSFNVETVAVTPILKIIPRRIGE